MRKILLSIFMAAGLLLTGLEASHAQATRTWVSGVGNDANPCSRTAPCKTFAGAISKTAVKGEINVLDPGGFGGVTITKSISIIADGVEGGVTACATNGIIINAAATDLVHIKGLDLEGCGTGLSGVRVISAASVLIEKCNIHGFKGSNGAAILANPTAANVKIVVSDSTLHENLNGVVLSPSGTGAARAHLERVIVSHNFGVGLQTTVLNGRFRVSNSSIIGNATGLDVLNGGTIVSFGNNVLTDNGTNGAFTSTLPLQ